MRTEDRGQTAQDERREKRRHKKRPLQRRQEAERVCSAVRQPKRCGALADDKAPLPVAALHRLLGVRSLSLQVPALGWRIACVVLARRCCAALPSQEGEGALLCSAGLGYAV